MRKDELKRRLAWLLVFRVAIASTILLLTLASDVLNLPRAHTSVLLYAVAVGNFGAVLLLGLILRGGGPLVAVATAYLTLAVASAAAVVQGTGVIDSQFTFLFALVILDAGIIAGRDTALVVATACSLAYGAQLALQLYGVITEPPGDASEWDYFTAVFVHFAGFYLTAVLVGYLATQLRRAREAASTAQGDLLHAHALQALILESLPVGVLTFDAQRKIRTVNAAATRILDQAQGALLGQPLSAAVESLLARGDAPAEITRAGLTRSIAISRAPLVPATLPDSETGEARARPALEVVVLEDRTDLVGLERRLQTQQHLASLGALAAAIAHEIRNPLAAISGSLELLGQGGLDDAAAHRLRDIVQSEIERLNRLVEEFLLYARPSPIERGPVDLVGLAAEVCAVARSDALGAGRALVLEGDSELIAEVDAQQVRQVLWNLLRNALEASPHAASVTLRISAGASGEALIEVCDRGNGVDPAIVQHMFEPFRTTKAQGTGLGLATVHRIIEAHGGTIELVARAGGGTRACVVLPPSQPSRV